MSAGLAVKPLEWTATPPEGMDGDPRTLYAMGIGGHYAADHDGCLWWAHEPFTFREFNDRHEAMAAAEIDHRDRINAALM